MVTTRCVHQPLIDFNTLASTYEVSDLQVQSAQPNGDAKQVYYSLRDRSVVLYC